MVKYNKQVLAHRTEVINNESLTALVIKDGDYYNIHIISETFKDEELNTLTLQEPKESMTLEDFTPTYLLQHIMSHFVWAEFNVDVECIELTERES